MRTRTPLALLLAAGCAAAPPWRELLPADGLGPWRVTAFGGEGGVARRDGVLVLGMGSPITGISWNGAPPPREDYELEVEAARLDGTDFFAAVTFPVGEQYCTFVPGGWGGATTGLSNVDGADASSNPTTRYVSYARGRFYTFRIRVAPDAIRAWLDGELLLEQARPGHDFGIRPEVDLSRPLGIAAYAGRAALRAVRIRRLP